MTELIARWRRYATMDGVYSPEEQAMYTRCADELEQEWHDYAHGDQFRNDCRICGQEWADMMKGSNPDAAAADTA